MDKARFNFLKVCRVCLAEDENLSHLTIHSDFLLNKVLKLSSNFQGFSLPGKLCIECVEEFQAVRRFMDKCEKTNAVLLTHCQQNDHVLEKANGYFDNTPMFASNVFAASTFENPMIDSKNKSPFSPCDEIASVFNIKLKDNPQSKHMRHKNKCKSDRRFIKKLKRMSLKDREGKNYLKKSALMTNPSVVNFMTKTCRNPSLFGENVTKPITTVAQLYNFYDIGPQTLPTAGCTNNNDNNDL